MKLTPVLLLSLHCAVSGLAAGEEWNHERSYFPPTWAKQLPYRGELHLQFAPGFQSTNSHEFWSYLITYKLEGNVLASRLELEGTLKAYDVGLYDGAVPESDVSVTLGNETTVVAQGHGAIRWNGRLQGFDSFFTKRPLVSQLEVTRWFCRDSQRTLVVILRSPADTKDPVWRELRGRAEALLCHASEPKLRRAGPADRIQAVETNLNIAGQRTTIAQRMRQTKVPGASVAVLAGGRIDWCKSYGVADLETGVPVTSNTLFQAASISKSLTAVTVLRLVEAGALSLDRDVNDMLKAWRVPASPLAVDSPVTIRRILSHTAGFNRSSVGDYAVGDSLPSALDALLVREPARNEPLKVEFRPGSKWSYSGGGYTVLQELLEESQRTNFAALVKREIFLPLGLGHSTFENLLPGDTDRDLAAGHRTNATVSGKWRMHPEQAAAGLWTTARDLAQLLAALYQARGGANETFLHRQSVQELWASQWKNSALGFYLNGSGRYCRINHDGANVGYRCQMVLYPELGCGAVILTNADEGNDLVQEVLASIAEEYGWPEYEP